MVIPKAAIDREIERLAGLDRPANGRRSAKVVHPHAGPSEGLAPGIDHTLVATTDDGVIEVLDDVTGAELWRATPGAQLAIPAVSAGVIAVGGSDGQVHAYDASDVSRDAPRPIWYGNIVAPPR